MINNEVTVREIGRDVKSTSRACMARVYAYLDVLSYAYSSIIAYEISKFDKLWIMKLDDGAH